MKNHSSNPYEPPQANVRFSPFGTRLKNAVVRATREYRAGLARERISRGQHVRTWLSILLLATIFMSIFGLFAIRLLISLKIISW